MEIAIIQPLIYGLIGNRNNFLITECSKKKKNRIPARLRRELDIRDRIPSEMVG